MENIGKYIKLRGGGTPSKSVPKYWDGKIPWLSVKDLKEDYIFTTEDSISEEGVQNSATRLVPEGGIVIGTRMAVGKVAIVQQETAINQDVKYVEITGDINRDYLFQFFKANRYKLEHKAKGATVKGIKIEHIENLKLALPSISDQANIANLLRHCEQLIQWRKESIALLDDYVRSVFLEMFGDPVSNNKNLDLVPLAELGEINRGVSKHRPRNAPELLGGDYPLIQTGDVSNAKTYIQDFNSTYSKIGLAQSKLWPKGTLCITIAANIAKTGVLTFDACFPDSVVGMIVFDGKATNLYIHHLFAFFQALLEKNAPAAAQKNINLKILREMKVPKPDFTDVLRFTSIAEEVENVQASMLKSLILLQNLYHSYSQRAFRGELDLSKLEGFVAAVDPILYTPPLGTLTVVEEIEVMYPRPGPSKESAGQSQKQKTQNLDAPVQITQTETTGISTDFKIILNEYPAKAGAFAQVIERLGLGGLEYEELRDRLFEKLDEQDSPLKQYFSPPGLGFKLEGE